MQGSNNPSLPRIVIDPSSPRSPTISSAFSPSTPINSTSSRSTPKSSHPPSQAEPKPAKRPKKVHPSFQPILRHLRTALCPLVSSTTGQQHPEFPKTLLAYHLLTSRQLDDLARHFHQVWPPCGSHEGIPRLDPRVDRHTGREERRPTDEAATVRSLYWAEGV
jgi:hypothetical protein